MISPKESVPKEKQSPGSRLSASVFAKNKDTLEKPCNSKKAKKPYIHKDPNADRFINLKHIKPPKPLDEKKLEQLDKMILLQRQASDLAEKSESELESTADERSPASVTQSPPSMLSGGLNRSSPRRDFSLASVILGSNASSALVDAAKRKYKDRNLVLPKSKRELKDKVEKILHLVPKLLAGEEPVSVFYTNARDQRLSSPHATMSHVESFDLPWRKYIAGFYGLRRQHFVSQLIQRSHGELLRKSPNKTVIYWAPDLFATYVLAPELILRIVMEDMALTKAKAEALLMETTDYGTHVADDVEFADNLKFDEFEILTKGLEKESV